MYCIFFYFTPRHGTEECSRRLQPMMLTAPAAKIIKPKPNMILLHMDAHTIPTLPKIVATPLISEEAEPVSPLCCSSMILVLKGREMVPSRENGAKPIQNSIGAQCPASMSIAPQMT